MRITLRCTLSQSVLSRYRCVQHDMLRTKRDLTNLAGSRLRALIQQDTCIVHKQKNKDCASRATTTLTDQLHQACSTNRGENKKDAATRQQAGRNNLVNVGQETNLITLLDLCVSSKRSPNNVTRLSHNSIGHGGRCRYGCSRMFISTPHLKTVS